MREGSTFRARIFPPMDARVRLLLGCAALGAVAVSGSAIVVLSIATFATIASLAAGLSVGSFARRMALPGALAVAAAVARLSWPGGQVLAVLPVGPWAITVTEAGLRAGTLAGARVLAMVAVVLASTAGVSAASLLGAARWLHVPATLVELASLMYRYLFLLREEAQAIVRAQSMRLGYAGGMQSVRCAAAAGALAFLRAYERGVRIHHAMLLRGYQGELPEERLPRLERQQLAYLAIGLVLLAGVVRAGSGAY
ncbi:MAG TPA: cobalt ECF transporter T component CbiQ [Armatimonadota bacterium]|nr:cobalt ECF transporter T component CbiQ [Armatimonadota bacterium]